MQVIKNIRTEVFDQDNPEHQDLTYVTSSMVDAIQQCPKKGIIRNVLRKTFTTGYRQMALEAGSLMHDVFSTLNFYQLGVLQGYFDHMNYHAGREMGISRWKYIFDDAHAAYMREELDSATLIERLCLRTIESSDFTDDPSDPKRTLANLEQVAIMMAAYWETNLSQLSIYVKDPDDHTAPIGIEMSLQMVVHAEVQDTVTNNITTRTFRFVGLADVVYQINQSKIRLGEFKTAATTSDAWRASFETRHQITGYMMALDTIFGNTNVVDNALLIGQAVPILKTRVNSLSFPVYREPIQYSAFVKACLSAIDIIDEYKLQPEQAVMHTGSCMAYFRPCAFIDLCTSAEEDQREMLKQMHISDDMSPSERKAIIRHE